MIHLYRTDNEKISIYTNAKLSYTGFNELYKLSSEYLNQKVTEIHIKELVKALRTKLELEDDLKTLIFGDAIKSNLVRLNHAQHHRHRWQEA